MRSTKLGDVDSNEILRILRALDGIFEVFLLNRIIEWVFAGLFHFVDNDLNFPVTEHQRKSREEILIELSARKLNVVVIPNLQDIWKKSFAI